MGKYVAWVDSEGCLDIGCKAVGNSTLAATNWTTTWDGRAIYCSTRCFIADGHVRDTPMEDDDSHGLLGVHGISLEPDCCEHCASCEEKVIQGIECEHECDDECIAKAREASHE